MDFQEFEALMVSAGLTELQFLAKAQLGIYTVREWRRHHEAPAWAGEFCRMAAFIKTGLERGQLKEEITYQVDPVEVAMTEQESRIYMMGSKEQSKEVYERVKARLGSSTTEAGLIG